MLLLAPLVSSAQLSIGLQGYRTGCQLQGKFVSTDVMNGWSAGAWVEYVYANEVLGLKAAVNYAQRGAVMEGVDFDADVATLELLTRLHMQDLDNRWARIVAGAGLYGQFPNNSNDILKQLDFGASAELGWDFKYLVVTVQAHKSILDVTTLPKGQRWVSFGLGIQVPVWKGK